MRNRTRNRQSTTQDRLLKTRPALPKIDGGTKLTVTHVMAGKSVAAILE